MLRFVSRALTRRGPVAGLLGLALVVSPLAPHTYNYVGHYFQSGDIAFMRIQAQLIARSGDWEHGFALGLPSNNNAASDGLLELGILPTFAVREALKVGAKTKVQLSVLGTELRRTVGGSSRMFAGAGVRGGGRGRRRLRAARAGRRPCRADPARRRGGR